MPHWGGQLFTLETHIEKLTFNEGSCLMYYYNMCYVPTVCFPKYYNCVPSEGVDTTMVLTWMLGNTKDTLSGLCLFTYNTPVLCSRLRVNHTPTLVKLTCILRKIVTNLTLSHLSIHP